MLFLLELALSSFFKAVGAVLWVAVPIFLFAVFWDLRLKHKRMQFLGKVEWQMLQIRIPRDNQKPMKAMEQFFTNLYSIYSFGIKPLDRYLDGKVDIWISFEIVGRGGGVSFYVRTPKDKRNLIEASLYAQFPDAEIIEAPDYTDELPSSLPNDTYDIFGTAYKLAKANPYPIKTYEAFEDTKEERRIDPLAPIFEAMSKLKEDEMIWLQFLISPTGAPTGDDLKKEGEEEIKKIIEEQGGKKPKEGESGPQPSLRNLPPAYKDAVDGISRKITKNIFQTTIRFIYIDRKDSFSGLNNAAVMGAFQQFTAPNMNALVPDMGTMTVFGGWKGRFLPWLKKARVLEKKKFLYENYIHRRFGISNRLADEKLPVLSSEELATLFHFPISMVRAPKIEKIGSRRGEPPVNLPVE